MTQEELGELIESHGRSIYGFCFHLAGSREIAEDLYQDTLLTVCERRGHLEKADDGGLRLRNYCLGVAIRQYKNRCRKYARRQTLSLDDGQNGEVEELAGAQTPEQQVLKELDRRRVRAAIDELPMKQRSVLYLFYYAEVPIAEIARLLKIPEGTVKSRLNAARKQLREMIGGNDDE